MKKPIKLILFILSSIILLISCSSGSSGGSGGNTISSIQITSSNGSYPMHIGINSQLTAIAVYQNGNYTNVTTTATWSSSNTAVATVNSTGLITPVSAGSVNIIASFSGIQNSISLTVSSGRLISVNVQQISYPLHLGINVQLSATAIFTDGTQDVTNLASWSSSNSSVASISSNSISKHKKLNLQAGGGGIISPISQGGATITASYGGVQNSDTVNISVSNQPIQSLSVTPNTYTSHIGVNTQFSVVAVFADGSQNISNLVTWSSSNNNVASVNSQGVATSLQSGLALITASFTYNNTQYTNSSSLNISNSTLQSIQITPNFSSTYANSNQQFGAIGVYSDGNQIITSSVSWSSSNLNVMTISNSNSSNGFATFSQAGTVSITAALNGVQASNTITVLPIQLQTIAISIPITQLPLGITSQASAKGTFTDGSTKDVTNSVIWASSNLSAVDASNISGNNGLIQGKISGQSSNITASFINSNGNIVSNTVAVSVINATLNQINITPASSSLQIGQNVQFKATGVFSSQQSIDLTSQALWTSSNTSFVSISNTSGTQGLAAGVGVGQANITAAYNGITSQNPATVNVTAAGIVSISITPNNSKNLTGITQQFLAQAVFTDGSLVNITNSATWSSSNQTVATVTSSGSVTSINAGTTNISASYNNITGISSYNINNYLYSAAQGTTGPINMFSIDQNTGRLNPLSPATIASGNTLQGMIATPNNYYVYAAANLSNAIYMYSVDPNTGLLTALNPATIATGGGSIPRQMAMTNDGRFLYLTLGSPNQIMAFSINQTTGQLSSLGTYASSGSTSGIAIANTSSGSYLYASGQTGNSIFEYSINSATGALTPLPTPSIATGSSPFSLAVTPNNKYLYTGTTGSAQVYMFSINQGNGQLTALTTPTAASGSTPTGIYATNNNVYVACQGAGISQYSIDPTGQLFPLNPASVTAGTTPFGVVLNSLGTYGYVSNQTSGDIYMYTVTNGVLSTQGNIATSASPSFGIIIR